MKRKITAVSLALALTLGLAGCSSSGSKSESAEPAATEAVAGAEAEAEGAESQDAGSEAEGDVEKAKVIICGTNGPGDTQSMAHEKFAEELNKLGDWDATAMVSSEMGSTDDVLEQALSGAGVIAATDPARLASYVPEFGILMMPYLFDSYDQMDALLDTPLYAEWSEKLEGQGLQLLTNNCITGFRMFVTNKEVKKPADLNGLKIRTMGTPISVNSVNAMGAIGISMNQSDAYNAIETGVVDGGEWQIPTIYSLRMFEVCDHISLTKHFLLTGSIVCGDGWYNSLTERQQKELKETAIKVYGETKQNVMEYEEKYLAEMQEMGVTVDEPDLDAFREATEYLYSDDATTGGVDFVALREELYSQMGIQ